MNTESAAQLKKEVFWVLGATQLQSLVYWSLLALVVVVALLTLVTVVGFTTYLLESETGVEDV